MPIAGPTKGILARPQLPGGIFGGGIPQQQPQGILGQQQPRRDWGMGLQVLGAGLRDIADPSGQNLTQVQANMAPQMEAAAAMRRQQAERAERMQRARALGMDPVLADIYANDPEAYGEIVGSNLSAQEVTAGNTLLRPDLFGGTYMAPKYEQFGDQYFRVDEQGPEAVTRRDQTYGETEAARSNLAGEGLTARGQDITMRGQDMSYASSARGQDLNYGASIYGTNASAQAAAARLAFDQEKFGADNSVNPEAVRQAALQSSQYSNAQIADLEEAIRQAGGTEDGGRTTSSRLRSLTPVPGAVGFGSGVASWASGTPAANVRALLDSVTGAVALERLDNLRQLAAQSGAMGSGLGQVTEREIAILRAARGAVDPSMGPELFLENANRLLRDLQSVQNERKTILQRDFPDIYEQLYGTETQGGADNDPLGIR